MLCKEKHPFVCIILFIKKIFASLPPLATVGLAWGRRLGRFENCDRSPSTRAERGLHASSTLFTKLGSSGNIGFEFPLCSESGCRRQIGCGPDLILKPNTGCPSIRSRKDNKILLKLFLSTYQPLRLGVLSIELNILSLSANNSACSR